MLLIIVGANGRLAKSIIQMARQTKIPYFALDKNAADVCDLSSLEIALTNIRSLNRQADIAVINCAAYTKVDAAESDSTNAKKLNVDAVGNLVKVTNHLQMRLIQISTDYVFDGKKDTPYGIFDQTNPLQVYGMTKLAAENIVSKQSHNYAIVRTSLLFSRESGDLDFVGMLKKKLLLKHEVRAAIDLKSNPTYMPHLASRLLELANRFDLVGTVHATNRGGCTRFELAQFIQTNLSKSLDLVSPVESSVFKSAAQRPRNSSLDLESWNNWGLTDFPDWTQAVMQVL